MQNSRCTQTVRRPYHMNILLRMGNHLHVVLLSLAISFGVACLPENSDSTTQDVTNLLLANNISSADTTSGWQSFTMDITSVSTPQVAKATTPDVDSAFWRRIDGNMEIMYNYVHSNNAGAAIGTGEYLFSLPTGYQINMNMIPGGNNNTSGAVGSALVQTVTPNNSYVGTTKVLDATRLQITATDGTTVDIIGDTWGPINTATYLLSFQASVPIAGW